MPSSQPFRSLRRREVALGGAGFLAAFLVALMWPAGARLEQPIRFNHEKHVAAERHGGLHGVPLMSAVIPKPRRRRASWLIFGMLLSCVALARNPDPKAGMKVFVNEIADRFARHWTRGRRCRAASLFLILTSSYFCSL